MTYNKVYFKDFTIVVAVGVIIAGLAVSAVLGQLDSERNQSIQRASVLSELSTRRAKLEGIVSSTFNITQGLIYIISHQRNISPELFNSIIANSMADNQHIRNVVIAPDNVVSSVYPHQGNERVIGLNYLENVNQRESVIKAMETGSSFLSGPVELVQGGIALIKRSPVFIESLNDSTNQYWGMVSIVANINSIFINADIVDSEDLEFLVVGKDGKGIDGEPIWGEPSINDRDPVMVDVAIPGGSWVLMAVPKLGWPKKSYLNSFYFLLGLINTLFLAFFLIILIKRNRSIRIKNFDLNNAIVERDKISDALLLSEVKYRSLIEEMRDVVVVINEDGIISYCSPSIEAFGGYKVSEVEGMFWREYIVDTIDGQTKQEIAGIIHLEKFERLELVFIPKIGHPFYIDVAIRTHKSSEGTIHFHCVLRNINDRKQMEVELTKSKEAAEAANRMKSSFLANMSHEVRTPMNAILGFSDLLIRGNPEEHETKQYLEVIHSSSVQLLNLINDIIDISLIESGQLKISFSSFRIKKVFDQVLTLQKLAATQHGLKLIIENSNIEAADVEILSDESRIVQVLNNLVGNAIKFTHEGSITIGFNLSDNDVHFYVRDTGIGIPHDYLNVIFERFRQVDERYSRKYGGTGLGLSICKSVVEMIGGQISVESELGKGSVFYVKIPRNGSRIVGRY